MTIKTLGIKQLLIIQLIGVAYSLSKWTSPKILQEHWPGRIGKVETKVPTVLVYKHDRLSSWGFLCENPDERYHPEKRCRDWFKLFLDQNIWSEQNWAKQDFEYSDVEQWYQDFLCEIYKHVKESLGERYPVPWAHKVEFVFSVPTTWNPATVNRYREIILAAGFGKDRHHSVEITLTEAQASAVYTAKEQSLNFDVFSNCDPNS